MLLATSDAVFRLEGYAPDELPEPVAELPDVRRIEEGANAAFAACADGGVYMLSQGKAVPLETEMEDTVHSLLLLSEDPLNLLIGTEPPHVYRLTGEGTRRLGAFDRLDCREDWYTPWGGPPAVRSMATSGDGRVYADIHVGSIMRSDDRGNTWEPVTPELHKDVHQVATCPASTERVYAETADSFWLSMDRGNSWLHRAEDLGERYGRCVAVHPTDPDLLLVTVSDGPHGQDVHGQLYRSEEAGSNWDHVHEGFPESTPDNIDTFHAAFAADGTAWTCVGNTLYVGRERAARWSAHWQAPGEIVMLCPRRW